MGILDELKQMGVIGVEKKVEAVMPPPAPVEEEEEISEIEDSDIIEAEEAEEVEEMEAEELQEEETPEPAPSGPPAMVALRTLKRQLTKARVVLADLEESIENVEEMLSRGQED